MHFLAGRQKASADISRQESARSCSVHRRVTKRFNLANNSFSAVDRTGQMPLAESDGMPIGSTSRQALRVQFLDRTEHSFVVDKKSQGQELLNRVFDYLDLREPSYFGLMYCENESCPGSTRWLDSKKFLRKQLKGSTRLYFRVKFFANHPETLIDEFTRYLYVTHLRREILHGNIYVNRETAVKLAALLMQADYGDFNGSAMSDSKDRMAAEGFVPLQGPEFLRDVRKEHARLVGCSPASADLRYLEIAKGLEMYGVEIYQATVSVRESMDLDVKVGVCSAGIVIFQGFQKITQFTWDKIAKLSFRRRHFFISVMPSALGLNSDYPARLLLFNGKDDLLVSLMLSSYQSSKALWKSCVEHHAFFRSAPVELTTTSTRDMQQRTTVVMGGCFNQLYLGKEAANALNRDPSGEVTRSRARLPAIQAPAQAVNLRRRFKTADGNSSFLVTEQRRRSRPHFNCVRATEPAGTDKAAPAEPCRFPSPTPSKLSVYSVLPPIVDLNSSADSASKPGLLIEPYESVLHDSIDRSTLQRLSAPSNNGQQCEKRNHSVSPRNPSDRLVSCPSRISNVNENASNSFHTTSDCSGNFEASMETLHFDLQNSSILNAFDQLYRSKPDYTFQQCRKHDNYYKNRYKDVLPYDQTRVCLKSGVDGDYINANHINIPINSVDTVNRYIATQGPLPTTSDDFWQMVWEQEVSQVVMLTTLNEGGRNKCHKYWPDTGDCSDYGRFLIRAIKETRSADQHSVHRELLFVRKDLSQERTIHHAQCESWPDHGVPSDYASFIHFVQYVRARRMCSPSSPVLVHCSAGIGRTGVIILAETALCLIEQSIPVYPIDIVKQMRNQRYSMIQTRQQFQFACEAILYAYRRRQQSSRS